MLLEPRLDVVGVEDRVRVASVMPVAAEHLACSRTRSAGCSRCPTAPPTRARIALLAAGLTSGCPGRYGARCAATPIGPMPGPPPPCGMQNVLCRLRWQTSAPIAAGLVSPTCAFMFAPSMYTWPPCSCTIAQTSWMRLLEHAVRGRIRDHQRRQPVLVLLGLGAQIVDVDVSLRRARDDDDAHAGHDGAGRIRAVRGLPGSARRLWRLANHNPETERRIF